MFIGWAFGLFVIELRECLFEIVKFFTSKLLKIITQKSEHLPPVKFPHSFCELFKIIDDNLIKGLPFAEIVYFVKEMSDMGNHSPISLVIGG